MILRSLFEQRSREQVVMDFLSGTDEVFTSGTGENISPYSALKLSAVFRCATILMDDISKLPVHPFVIRGEGREIDYNHPTARLLSVQPNELMNPMDFFQMLEYKRQFWGAGLAWVNVDYNGYPVELIPLPTEYVVPFLDIHTNQLWYIVSLPGLETRKLPPADVICVKNFSTDGITWHSTLEYARESVGAGQAEQKFENNFYLRGMKLGGILETPSKLGGEEKDILRREFERMTSGLDNMHRLAVLDMNQKFTPLSMPIKDAQFIETRQMNIRDIARYWKMPLYKLQEGKEAYSSNEMQNLDYLVSTLDTILVRYEQEFRLKLLSRTEQKKRYYRFNRSALLRADAKSRAEFLKIMVESGLYTVNEARAYEEMNRYQPGSENPADQLRASLNFVPLENWGKTQPAPANTTAAQAK